MRRSPTPTGAARHVARLACLAACTVASPAARTEAAERPNILWLTSEDHGPHLGCYGDRLARTPHVDALAARGLIFRHVWSTAPVCAPARTALISGLYPSATGALHMRSLVPPPAGTALLPELLRAAGYHCTNNSKTDYNLRAPADAWTESSPRAHWRSRRAGQPFFAVFNATASHESRTRGAGRPPVTDPAAVRLPACHPDLPEIRRSWAAYYDQLAAADAAAGTRLRELADDGLADDTIVFYFSDHGPGLPRHKRWPGDAGLHVPLVAFFPPRWRHLAPPDYAPGGDSDRLVGFVDFAPTMLGLAGVRPPAWMQGHAFAGRWPAPPPSFVFGERGRTDERTDLVRAVSDGRHVYLRNFLPHLPHGQHVAYQFESPATRAWHALFAAGGTTPEQSAFWRAPRPAEELYDLATDPDEVRNLATDPAHTATRTRLRAALATHLAEVRDVCFLPEADLLARSADRAPADAARAGDIDPAAAIAAAMLASDAAPDAVDRLAAGLADADAAVRAWSALGLLMRGPGAVRPHAARLATGLDDPSASVRIAAAEALAAHGDDTSRDRALDTLALLADPLAHGAVTAAAALEAIDHLGPVATRLRPRIAALEVPRGGGRYAGYVPRLVAAIAAADADAAAEGDAADAEAPPVSVAPSP